MNEAKYILSVDGVLSVAAPGTEVDIEAWFHGVTVNGYDTKVVISGHVEHILSGANIVDTRSFGVEVLNDAPLYDMIIKDTCDRNIFGIKLS